MSKKQRFNKTLLSTLVRENVRGTISDSEASGLKFTVGKTRSTFHFEKRISGRKGSAITITLGAFPAISIEEARQEARRLANLCEKGVDPRQHLAMLEVSHTGARIPFEDAMKKFLAAKASVNPGTLGKYESALRCLFPKSWYRRCLTSITSEMLVQQFHELRVNSSGQGHELLKFFNNLWNTCATLFLDARNKRILKENPVPVARQLVRHIPRAQPRRLIIPASELGRFVVLTERWGRNEIDGQPATVIEQRACHLVLLCLFTGMRGIEARNLRWEYIDFQTGIIRLPGGVNTADGGFQGTKNKRDHQIPLSTYAAELLQRLYNERTSISPFVLPLERAVNQAFAHYRHAAQKLSALVGLPFTVHACRRTFASIADEVGLDFLKVKRSLNHSFEGGVTGGYVNPSFNPAKRREYFQLVCDYILACRAEYLGQQQRKDALFDQQESLEKVRRYALELGLNMPELQVLIDRDPASFKTAV